MTLKNLVDSAAQGEETRKLLEENSKRQIEQMRTEVREKDQKLESQEARIKELIDQWGQETEVRRKTKRDDQLYNIFDIREEKLLAFSWKNLSKRGI